MWTHQVCETLACTQLIKIFRSSRDNKEENQCNVTLWESNLWSELARIGSCNYLMNFPPLEAVRVPICTCSVCIIRCDTKYRAKWVLRKYIWNNRELVFLWCLRLNQWGLLILLYESLSMTMLYPCPIVDQREFNYNNIHLPFQWYVIDLFRDIGNNRPISSWHQRTHWVNANEWC